MNNFFDQHSIETQHKQKLLSNLRQIFHNIKGWLAAWFVLTEEEKIAAGVYIGRMGEGE